MNLDIAGRRALVCASSAGLGRGCAHALAEAGAAIVLNGRTEARLEAAARAIRAATGAEVTTVVADVTCEEGRAQLLDTAGAVDILVNNAGGPPLTPFDAITLEALRAGINANMITPIAMLQGVVPGMVERRFGRVVNITSASVKMPVPGLELSSGARAGLTGFVAGVARSVMHANVTINNLLPGTFDTDRIRAMGAAEAERTGRSEAEILAQRQESIPAGRIGDPAEFGAACAFLCSAGAGYITGQNLIIDGGKYKGIP